MDWKQANDLIIQAINEDKGVSDPEVLITALSSLFFRMEEKPEINGEIWSCPYCKRNGHISDNPPFCKWCGKALDWRGIK